MKCGNDVVLVNVSLVNVPGSVDIPTVNSLALVIPVTGNVPLNPELPKPVVLTLDLILINFYLIFQIIQINKIANRFKYLYLFVSLKTKLKRLSKNILN